MLVNVGHQQCTVWLTVWTSILARVCVSNVTITVTLFASIYFDRLNVTQTEVITLHVNCAMLQSSGVTKEINREVSCVCCPSALCLYSQSKEICPFCRIRVCQLHYFWGWIKSCSLRVMFYSSDGGREPVTFPLWVVNVLLPTRCFCVSVGTKSKMRWRKNKNILWENINK